MGSSERLPCRLPAKQATATVQRRTLFQNCLIAPPRALQIASEKTVPFRMDVSCSSSVWTWDENGLRFARRARLGSSAKQEEKMRLVVVLLALRAYVVIAKAQKSSPWMVA